jgi:hypothetical protein
MPVRGTYLLMAGGGAIVLWSGLRGHGWTTVLRDVISGKKPPTTEELAITTAPGAYASGGIGTSPVDVAGPSGPGERAWDIALLTSLGAPSTTANIQSLIHWRTHESPWDNQPPDGATYTHNPLNTTQDMPGAVSINSVGVKKYTSTVSGIAATRKTLLNGNYGDVVSALRSGKGLASGSYRGLSTWSGGAYSSV